MDRGAWWATVQGVERVGHDWATKHSTVGLRELLSVEKLHRFGVGKKNTTTYIFGAKRSVRKHHTVSHSEASGLCRWPLWVTPDCSQLTTAPSLDSQVRRHL